MKNGIKYLIFALLIAGVIGTSANAMNSFGFAGSAASGWAYVTNPSTNYLKDNGNGNFAVGWTYSNQSSHKMWFRLVNSDGASRGSGCLSYLSTAAISTSASRGYYYWLQAKREYIVDPSTYVSGTWSL